MAITLSLLITVACATQVYSATTAFLTPLDSRSVGKIALNTSLKDDAQRVDYYVVREGDTLSSIAADHGLTIWTVAWANNIDVNHTIAPGDELIILPFDGVEHKVKAGESLTGLANRYGVTLMELISFNKVALADNLQAGEELIIPGEELASNYLTARGGEERNDRSVTVRSVSTDEEEDIEEEEIEEEPTVVSTAPARGGWLHPVPGAVVTQGAHGHNGVDFGAPVGTPVLAADGGTITQATTGYNGGYGTTIEIAHPDGTTSLYAHLSSITVSVGEVVSAGETIGYVGNTGRSTGPHLHFEVTGGANPFGSCGYLSRCGS